MKSIQSRHRRADDKNEPDPRLRKKRVDDQRQRTQGQERFRDHEKDGLAGLITVQGVKYTTARALAERAVLLACSKLGRPETGPAPPAEPLAWARSLEGSLTEQARVAVREEMGRTLADVVLRRLDLGPAGPPGEAEVIEVTAAMAEERGWDESRRTVERAALARFYEDAYNGSQAMP